MSEQDEFLTQPTSAPKWPLALRYGLLTALALFVAGLLLEFTGIFDPAAQKGTSIANLVNLIVIFAGLFIATREYKKECQNSLTYGQGLGFGALMALVVTLTTILLTVLQITFISPDMLDIAREMGYARMEDQGMSEEEIETMKPFMDVFFTPLGFSIAAAFIVFIMNFIVALVTSAIHQNAKAQDVV